MPDRSRESDALTTYQELGPLEASDLPRRQCAVVPEAVRNLAAELRDYPCH